MYIRLKLKSKIDNGGKKGTKKNSTDTDKRLNLNI